MFPKSVCLRLMVVSEKSTAMLTSAVFNTRQMLRLKGALKQELSGILGTASLAVNNFQNI